MKNVLKIEDFKSKPSDELNEQELFVKMNRLNMQMSVLECSDPTFEILLDEYLCLSDLFLEIHHKNKRNKV